MDDESCSNHCSLSCICMDRSSLTAWKAPSRVDLTAACIVTQYTNLCWPFPSIAHWVLVCCHPASGNFLCAVVTTGDQTSFVSLLSSDFTRHILDLETAISSHRSMCKARAGLNRRSLADPGSIELLEMQNATATRCYTNVALRPHIAGRLPVFVVSIQSILDIWFHPPIFYH